MSDIVQFVDVGTGQIDIRELARNGGVSHIMSTVLYHKVNGAIDDKPSFAFLCRDPAGNQYLHQITLATLAATLEKGGYELRRRSPVLRRKLKAGEA